ncbi:Acetyl-CoA dehydrogenase C-terminal like [Marinobacter daqiaonensis]|uniref:Acetyl-CoA dehydrogenase C-terminal like n=1 Tax=Marinobacter daqiaonensis TaxID=650891 RepID=A0A1I6HF60_9GAMM|nr:acyl-CoA dehydrogenase C-terminal domain-containing protein [Marinobacter daqiaonensis]SFR53079.1 Acetyl-CoA dehydrogenase C-terminal like [Marinobacter daqiaonensis]
MVSSQVSAREFLFQLFDVLDTGGLVARDRYQEHTRESLKAVVETFTRLSGGETGLGDDRAEALADGSVGVVPEVVLTLGNGLYDAAGQGSRLFRTRSEDLLATPVAVTLTAWQGFRVELASQDTAALDAAAAADQRRRLLVRKSRCEAALAMCLYGASLAENAATHPDPPTRQAAERLLQFLTPLLSWWPLDAAFVSSLQGAGRPVAGLCVPDPRQTRELARDFLGLRVWQHQSHGLQLLLQALQADLEAAVTQETQQWALSLSETLQRAVKVTQTLAQGLHRDSAEQVLCNANRYLNLFGEILAAWMWLRQANAAAGKLNQAGVTEEGFYRGKLQAARYFFHWELPEVAQDLVLLQNQDSTCLDMRTAWF